MKYNERKMFLSELTEMGVTIVMDGEFRTGRKFDYVLPDGIKVEAKIGGLLVNGNYLVAYKLDDKELGREITPVELEKLINIPDQKIDK